MLSIVLTTSSKKRHPIAEAALFGTIALGTLTGGNVASAQQGRPSAGRDTAAQQIPLDQLPIDQRLLRDPEADPNLPGMASPQINGLKLQWDFFAGSMSQPSLVIRDQRLSNNTAQYLGWNDEGSLLKLDDGKIYVWNLKQNSLTVRYKGFNDIPSAVVARLKNNPDKQEILASREPKPAPKPVAPVQVARNQGNIPDDDARKAIGMSNPPGARAPAAQGEITGTGASIHGGTLAFTRADNSRATYKVERPRVTQGNPQASADITGAWVAMEDDGKGIIFTVQTDNSVTGREMPAHVIQMLMQAPPH